MRHRGQEGKTVSETEKNFGRGQANQNGPSLIKYNPGLGRGRSAVVRSPRAIACDVKE
jgi:hypothetical protein